MKSLACEMCGGTDLIKQEGVFVCQNCGMKYSVEDAKKMMNEDIVEVQGAGKVGSSSTAENYLINARRAKEEEDWEEVEKYYNMIKQNNPTNLEAVFYSAYAKVASSLLEEDIYKREHICEVFCKSISIIASRYDIKNSNENKELIKQMHNDLFKLYGSNFVYTVKTDGYGNKTDNSNDTYYLFVKIAHTFIESLKNILELDDQLIYLKIIYEQYKYAAHNSSLTLEARISNRDSALKIANIIKQIDSSFVVDYMESLDKEAKNKNNGRVAMIIIGIIFALLGLILIFAIEDSVVGISFGGASIFMGIVVLFSTKYIK